MQGVHIIKPRTSVNLNNQILERAVTVVGKILKGAFITTDLRTVDQLTGQSSYSEEQSKQSLF